MVLRDVHKVKKKILVKNYDFQSGNPLSFVPYENVGYHDDTFPFLVNRYESSYTSALVFQITHQVRMSTVTRTRVATTNGIKRSSREREKKKRQTVQNETDVLVFKHAHSSFVELSARNRFQTSAVPYFF